MDSEFLRRFEEPVAPAKVFDDVFYIGRRGVGVFAIPTDEGIVLIDSMDPTDAAEKHIEPGLRELGLDPKDINTVIITHGHFDHFAGARRLQEKYGCKVALGLVDSGFMVCSHSPLDNTEYPHIDVILEDRKPLTFGRHTFLPVLNPGHTPGGMSLIFNVHDGGEEHVASLWVGAGLPRGAEQMRWTCEYLNSLHVFNALCREHRCDVVLGVHPHRCGLFEKLDRLAERKPGEPHPFVVGADGVTENLRRLGHGALEQAAKLIDEM